MMLKELSLSALADVVNNRPKAALVESIHIYNARKGDVIFWDGQFREVITSYDTYRMKDNVRVDLEYTYWNSETPTQREYFIPRQEVLRLINPEQK